MKLPIDTYVLAGVWLGTLFQLAYDAADPATPRLIRILAMTFFVFFAIAGISWRRFWKAHRRAIAEKAELQQAASRYDKAAS